MLYELTNKINRYKLSTYVIPGSNLPEQNKKNTTSARVLITKFLNTVIPWKISQLSFLDFGILYFS